MSDQYDAKAKEIIDSISGPDWRRFCEMGDSGPVAAAISSALRTAVNAEREACASIADEYRHDGDWDQDACAAIATTIRQRGSS